MKEVKMVDILRVEPKQGEVGIEVELEGRRVNMIAGDQHWRVEGDGSLRGDSAEFVLKNPCQRKMVKARLLRFKAMIKDIKVEDTGRAGIHIHINVQEMSPREVIQFLTLYMLFENILVDFCGPRRVGNLFCLRTSDALYLLRNIREVIKEGKWHRLHDDAIRYASVNLKALGEYGSLEFRAMRSTTDIELIQKWVEILLSLKDRAREFKTPQEIIETISRRGSEKFYKDCLGKFNLDFNHRHVIDGIRNAQFIAYARDWNEEPKEKVRQDDMAKADWFIQEPPPFEEILDRLNARAVVRGNNIPQPEAGMAVAPAQQVAMPDGGREKEYVRLLSVGDVSFTELIYSRKQFYVYLFRSGYGTDRFLLGDMFQFIDSIEEDIENGREIEAVDSEVYDLWNDALDSGKFTQIKVELKREAGDI